jgi:hypothetical protein
MRRRSDCQPNFERDRRARPLRLLWRALCYRMTLMLRSTIRHPLPIHLHLFGLLHVRTGIQSDAVNAENSRGFCMTSG